MRAYSNISPVSEMASQAETWLAQKEGPPSFKEYMLEHGLG
jgi:hypothetical protein